MNSNKKIYQLEPILLHMKCANSRSITHLDLVGA